MQPSKLSALSSQSPFAQMAQQDQKKPDAAGQPKKPGILGRLCACGREPEAQADEDPSGRGQPLEEKSRSNSTGSTVGRVMPCTKHVPSLWHRHVLRRVMYPLMSRSGEV